MHLCSQGVAWTAFFLFYHIGFSICFPKGLDQIGGPSLRHRQVGNDLPGSSNFDGLPLQQRQADTASEPDSDFASIKTIAAIGDSYSAGIGAGNRIDWRCSRYDLSYPAIITSDWRLANKPFQFLSCSGATSVDILKNQVPKITGTVDTV